MFELERREIWLYQPVIDFRKQMNGLAQVVLDEMGLQPNDGSVYVFRNRQRDKVKVLFWDKNGFWVGYKRLEKGKFDFPKPETGSQDMTWEQFKMLVSGMPILNLGKTAQKEVVFS